MKGKNILKLNQETMCAAMQVWIKETFSGPTVPNVTLVRAPTNTSTYGGSAEFEVEVESPETPR